MSSAKPASRQRFRGRLARTVLLVLLLLSLVPLLLLGSIAYLRARTLLSDQIYTLLADVAEVQGQRISGQVSTGRLLLSRTLADEAVSQALQTVLQASSKDDPALTYARQVIFGKLETINQPEPFFNQFLVVSSDGFVRLATRQEWEGTDLKDFSPGGELIGADTSRAVVGFEPFYPDSFVILSPAPVQDREGSPLATVIGVAESPIIRDLIEKTAFYTTSHYFVTPSAQAVGINPYPNSLNKLVTLYLSDSQRQVILKGLQGAQQPGVQEISSFQGQKVIAAYTWLPELQTGWVAEIPQQAVYRQMNSLFLFVAILFITLATLTGLVVWLTSRGLVRPLLELAATAQAFADGQWGKRAPVKRDDEVGLLAHSFNLMADELSSLYRSLEYKVKERTRQIHTSAELSQILITSTSLDELLRRTTRLFVDHFGMAFTAIYLVDESGSFANLRQAGGFLSAQESRGREKIHLDHLSLIGEVILERQARLQPLQKEGGEISSNLYEAGVPISTSEHTLGALYLQVESGSGLQTEKLDELQTLVNQLAPALRSFHLLEAAQINLEETTLLYQASHQIAQAENADQVFRVATRTLQGTAYASLFLLPEGTRMRVGFALLPYKSADQPAQGWLPVNPAELETFFASRGLVLLNEQSSPAGIPQVLLDLQGQMSCDSTAYLPVMRGAHLAALLALGTKEGSSSAARSFSSASLQAYLSLADQISTALEKIRAIENMDKSLAELRTVDTITRAISLETDLQALYRVIHKQINSILGPVDFFIAMYDTESSSIHIPFYEVGDHRLELSPYPLGDDLISTLIRTRQPLLLNDDAEIEAAELGGLAAGGRPRSWMAAPLLIGGAAMGALGVQDTKRENRFSSGDQRLLVTLAAQVSAAVRNTFLLDRFRQQAERERQLYEITSRIRRSTDMKTILETTANELAEALKASRAHIEIRVDANAPPATGTQATPGNGRRRKA